MALVEIKVPDIGDFDSVGVIEVLVKAGDTIKVEQSLVTVESDKASMEIPSSQAGVVKELKVALGDQIREGSVLLLLETADSATAPKEEAASAQPAEVSTVKAPETKAEPAVATSVNDPVATTVTAADTTVDIRIPNIGDFQDVAVIELLAKVGDTVAVEQSLFTVESDKASMEIPSPAAGTIVALTVQLGDKVNVGDVVGQMVVQGAAAPAAAPAPAAQNTAPAPAAAAPAAPVAVAPVAAPAPVAVAVPTHNPSVAPSAQLPHASPSVRKFARELGVPLAEVKGSGQKGRITQEDVMAFTKSVMAGAVQTAAQAAAAPKATPAAGGNVGGLEVLAWPKVDFAKFGAVERKELSRIKKISGANLHRNWVMIPHVTNNDLADITELEAFRVQTNAENAKAKSDVKVTMLAFVIKAVVAALKKFPEFNASLDGDTLVYKQYYHIGFAADTPNGLVVPVLKNADQKGILQISQEMGELAKKARDGKLGAADMQGGCFSISSLGGIGGTHFTPIINAPEVAILGLSKSAMQPVWDGKGFQPRLMLPLSLSYDHRVIDGAAAARFNAYLGAVLADYRRILL